MPREIETKEIWREKQRSGVEVLYCLDKQNRGERNNTKTSLLQVGWIEMSREKSIKIVKDKFNLVI